MRQRLKVFLFFILMAPLSLVAAIDTYEFADSTMRERFTQLTFELRCPKCQNQNLKDSNSPIASDLRNEIYKMLQAGMSNTEIVDFMVTRYGDFVLYRPPVNQKTYLLWYGPAGMLLIGVIIVLLLTRKKSTMKHQEQQVTEHLSDEESLRLKKLLHKEPKQ